VEPEEFPLEEAIILFFFSFSGERDWLPRRRRRKKQDIKIQETLGN
jgi:hypothetical protein